MDEPILQLLVEVRDELLAIHARLILRKAQKEVWQIIQKIDAVIKAQELRNSFDEKIPPY